MTLLSLPDAEPNFRFRFCLSIYHRTDILKLRKKKTPTYRSGEEMIASQGGAVDGVNPAS